VAGAERARLVVAVYHQADLPDCPEVSMSALPQHHPLDDHPVMGGILHIYLVPNDRRAQPGDKARCGHVKRSCSSFPSNAAAQGSGLQMCMECEYLSKLGAYQP
jgi:hypothetical protein